MTLDHYQQKSRLSIPNDPKLRALVTDLKYLGLALAGETGEVAEKIKRIFRDTGGELQHDSKQSLILELGDILWYLTRIADVLQTPLSQVARSNLKKIESRIERNQLHGSGDNR